MIVRMLLDGLWQGGAIVAVAYLVRCSVPRRNATTRYAVWFTALLALIAVPVLTTLPSVGALWGAAFQPPEASSAWTISLVPARSLVSGAAGFLTPVAPWIAVAWGAGVILCLLRLGASLVRVGRIRRNATEFSASFGKVLVSADVAIPIAVGFRKPTIVVPKHLLEMLAPADLARVLAHERAHIRRHDVLGNLVQRIVEALLYFNPWVHFVGRNLVLEREAACDDWAVQKTGAPDEYAACLASLAQRLRRSRTPLATPSALGSRHALVARIERLVGTASRPIAINYYVVGATVALFALLTLGLEAFSPAFAFAPSESGSMPGFAGARVAAAACTNPNVEARYIEGPAPNLPHGSNVKGSATAFVTIAPNGSVLRASIWKRSGNAQIDQSVLDAAKRGKYSPKLIDCKRVEGTYLFHADFAPNAP